MTMTHVTINSDIVLFSKNNSGGLSRVILIKSLNFCKYIIGFNSSQLFPDDPSDPRKPPVEPSINPN